MAATLRSPTRKCKAAQPALPPSGLAGSGLHRRRWNFESAALDSQVIPEPECSQRHQARADDKNQGSTCDPHDSLRHLRIKNERQKKDRHGAPLPPSAPEVLERRNHQQDSDAEQNEKNHEISTHERLNSLIQAHSNKALAGWLPGTESASRSPFLAGTACRTNRRQFEPESLPLSASRPWLSAPRTCQPTECHHRRQRWLAAALLSLATEPVPST